MVNLNKSEILLLKDQNSFEIRIAAETNCSNTVHNINDNSRSNFNKTYLYKNLTVKKISVETQFKVTRKIQFNTNKKKVRGGSRTAATSKMERFVIIVNGWKPLTIITKRSILDVAAVLDPPLKVVVVCDCLTKFLRSGELSTSERSVTVIKHPGSAPEDMTDYIKPIARKRPDTILLHVGTNDFTKGTNTMKNISTAQK